MKLNIPSIPSSEITPQGVFDKRRELIKIAAGGALGLQMSSWFSRDALAQTKLAVKPNPAYVLTDRKTSYNDVASYNNFYEFGTDKSEPAVYASSMITSPWKLTIEGLVASPKTFDIDDLMKLMPLVERVFRMRCVVGWSMVFTWVG
jgi:sulfoxide reductase catalytic subunit YedY